MKIFEKITDFLLCSILLCILCFFWNGILHINFAGNPGWYCTDMYSDMLYAAEVWDQKSLFPEGWVFGNQLYVVATPVLAALFYGITKDPCTAMGIASSLLGAGVLISFCWMIKPFLTKLSARLAAAVFFMTVILVVGDPVFVPTGWQLFFTMCAYYACYAITAFLSFGCYLRSDREWDTGFRVVLLFACLLSFGTGIQSLRQTAVMTLPLIAVEMIRYLYSRIQNENYSCRSAVAAGLLAVSNLEGVLCTKLISVDQNTIFGEVHFRFPADLFGEILSKGMTAFSLFGAYRTVAMILFCAGCLGAVLAVALGKVRFDNKAFLCMFLCAASTAGIWAIAVFTTMRIREIYYFLLFPMAATGVALIYSSRSVAAKIAVVLVIALLFVNRRWEVQYYINAYDDASAIQQVSDFLEDRGITTIYSDWNLGDDVAIASDFRIQAGFWDSEFDVYNSIKYLCNPAVYDADPSECVYVVRSEEVFAHATEVAQNRGIHTQLLHYFPETNVYVFTADQNLMK